MRFTADHGLLLSIKGGDHNFAGTILADGGLTLDMSRTRGVTVDPAARLAHAGPGACCGTSTADPAVRPRDDARVRGGDEGGRPDPRRWIRSPDAPVRLGGRQPGGGRDRHGGRKGTNRGPGEEPGPVLGDPGRWAQLRRRRPLHIPAAQGRPRHHRRPGRMEPARRTRSLRPTGNSPRPLLGS
ncbi:FAD-binding protein [Streptomyces mutabilis]|uniref:FAD-binding protein n=1 Tax=Streptomyces TaxID=1883 RepID=UPI003987D98F